MRKNYTAIYLQSCQNDEGSYHHDDAISVGKEYCHFVAYFHHWDYILYTILCKI